MSTDFPKAVLVLPFVAMIVLLAGCGSGLPPTGEVVGKVTVDGKPVTAGTVKFYPAKGDPVPTELGVDGTFRATGVPVGKARVAVETIHFRNLASPPPGIAKQLGGPRIKYVPTPEKYAKPDSSELQVDVQDGRAVTFDIELVN
jgi:hypothetical protein